MPKTTEAHREARREQILHAAYRCFGRKGFHQTTMRDICTEADLSPGAVYNYFDGKDDLIRAVADSGRASTRTLFEQMASENGALTTLRHGLEYIVRRLDTQEGAEAARFEVRLWAESLNAEVVNEMVQTNLDDVVALFADLIREAQEEGAIRSDVDAQLAARLMVVVYQGLAVQKTIDAEVDGAAVLDTCFRGLRWEERDDVD